MILYLEYYINRNRRYKFFCFLIASFLTKIGLYYSCICFIVVRYKEPKLRPSAHAQPLSFSLNHRFRSLSRALPISKSVSYHILQTRVNVGEHSSRPREKINVHPTPLPTSSIYTNAGDHWLKTIAYNNVAQLWGPASSLNANSTCTTFFSAFVSREGCCPGGNRKSTLLHSRLCSFVLFFTDVWTPLDALPEQCHYVSASGSWSFKTMKSILQAISDIALQHALRFLTACEFNVKEYIDLKDIDQSLVTVAI